MTQKAKLLAAMRGNPAADWTIADVRRLCEAHRVFVRTPRSGSSHVTISHHSQQEILTIPARKAIKPFYIGRLVWFIEAVVRSEL